MELKAAGSAIEAILFSAGAAVEEEQLAAALGLDIGVIRKITKRLMDCYDEEKRGMRIIKLEDSYQMCTREDYYESIRRINEPKRKQGLSSAALETLSIIAYNQPVTKSAVENIRGVDCSGPLARLLERGLVEEAGRLEKPGKPILYATGNEFLRSFGLSSLCDLPRVEGLGANNELKIG